MSCAVALAVMEVLERDNLRDHATRVGNHLLNSLKQLMNKHSLIGDVRGIGLFVGIELVKDREKRTPATEEAQHIVTRYCKNEVILCCLLCHSI